MMNDTPRPDAAATPAENDKAAAPAEATVDPVVAAQQEAASLKDKLLRTLADMENLRRRTEREVADARVYGISSFARDVLVVADNFRRALDAIGPELRTTADAGIRAFIEGVELTERELLKSLEKNGIRKIEPLGEKFDPNIHQAMYEVPDASVPAGSVVQVVQPGYLIGERVLRPAMVGVSKGGPKTAPGQGNNQAASNGADASQDPGSA